jgi:dolichyl-phosphate-mannose--protein O-mannosyl transferase
MTMLTTVVRCVVAISFLAALMATFYIDYQEVNHSPRLPIQSTGQTHLRYAGHHVPVYITEQELSLMEVKLPLLCFVSFGIGFTITFLQRNTSKSTKSYGHIAGSDSRRIFLLLPVSIIILAVMIFLYRGVTQSSIVSWLELSIVPLILSLCIFSIRQRKRLRNDDESSCYLGRHKTPPCGE